MAEGISIGVPSMFDPSSWDDTAILKAFDDAVSSHGPVKPRIKGVHVSTCSEESSLIHARGVMVRGRSYALSEGGGAAVWGKRGARHASCVRGARAVCARACVSSVVGVFADLVRA